MGKNKKRSSKNNSTELQDRSRNFLDSLSDHIFWTDSHGEKLSYLWSLIPSSFGQLVVTLSMFIFGLTVRGEWLLLAVYFVKYLQSGGESNYVEDTDELIDSVSTWFAIRFKGYFRLLWISTVISYLTYFGVGGFLHWYYYVNRRHKAEEWKCQPNNWLPSHLERHEIMVGSLSLVFGSSISAAISTYIMNGGTGTLVYFQPGDYGYFWLVLQVPLVFMYQDYLTYWTHRMYHTPWLYKHFHKLHHTYKQPTAFSVTAIHPFEFMHVQLGLLSPIVICPMYWLNLCCLYAYIYYHGIIDHSGINFKRHWWQPWQPDCIFHDNHHQYFHVNFGFNMELWDKLHGTIRRKDRIYREDIFYGFGKKLDEASVAERKEDEEERRNENPLAHRENQNEFLITSK